MSAHLPPLGLLSGSGASSEQRALQDFGAPGDGRKRPAPEQDDPDFYDDGFPRPLPPRHIPDEIKDTRYFQVDGDRAENMVDELEGALAASLLPGDSLDDDRLTDKDYEVDPSKAGRFVEALVETLRLLAVTTPISAYLLMPQTQRLRNATNAVFERARAIINAQRGIVLKGNSKRSRNERLRKADKELVEIGRFLYKFKSAPSDSLKFATDSVTLLMLAVQQYASSQPYREDYPDWYKELLTKQQRLLRLTPEEEFRMRTEDSERAYRKIAAKTKAADAYESVISLKTLIVVLKRRKDEEAGPSNADDGFDLMTF